MNLQYDQTLLDVNSDMSEYLDAAFAAGNPGADYANPGGGPVCQVMEVVPGILEQRCLSQHYADNDRLAISRHWRSML